MWRYEAGLSLCASLAADSSALPFTIPTTEIRQKLYGDSGPKGSLAQTPTLSNPNQGLRGLREKDERAPSDDQASCQRLRVIGRLNQHPYMAAIPHSFPELVTAPTDRRNA